ncbi:MAG: 23S rRNA (uracil(1939)-C(5))-methyltransferase RlmD [Ignavibacteriae bacterium]|nr:23S rRNA (uracil(1939)-C(5))-methyltransferase RlmD [Ignavibacteriota bacterium]
MKKFEEHVVALESFAFEGKSIARVDGFVVFVDGGVPGDEVRVRINKVKKQHAEASVVEVVKSSPLRAVPPCAHFGTCGGCKWQHVDYQAQLDFKRQHVIDALERIGGFTGVQVNPTIGSEDVYFYRNKMEFSFGTKWITREELNERNLNPEPRTERETFALGMHIPQRFDKIVDINECHLQSHVSNQILNLVRQFCLDRQLSIYSTFTHTGYLRNLVIRQSAHTNELMVNLVTSEDTPELLVALSSTLFAAFPSITTIVNNITQRKSQVAIGDYEKVYHGPGFVTEKIGKRTYRISANSFFQTNTKQAERLYDVATRMAQLSPDDVVFDLYSGTGTIALHIADSVKEVVGVENVEAAVEDAKKNAEANCVTNCTFILGDLKDRLTKDTAWLGNHPKPNVMIIDPPRAGMHEKVVREVVEMRPERIVYVSCNPATQARDLKLICNETGYELVEVQPVDMFPHTYHIENVVSLKLRP